MEGPASRGGMQVLIKYRTFPRCEWIVLYFENGRMTGRKVKEGGREGSMSEGEPCKPCAGTGRGGRPLLLQAAVSSSLI